MKNLIFHPKKLYRKRIEDALKEAEEISLILIVGPMGYGKSTIVHDYLNQIDEKKVWFSFGQNENDMEWIWTRLTDEFRKAEYFFADKMAQMGIPKGSYEINCFLDKLENLFQEPCYLVLDNYDECNCPEFGILLEEIAYRQVKNLHIFIISRSYPEIYYEEMWMKGCCMLIEQSFLALTEEEQEEFFQMNDVFLKKEEQERVYEYTEGWMSAVYLVLLDYKKNGQLQNLGGINNLVHRFIFEPLSEDCKRILMCMSLFDEFTAEQAAYISKVEASIYLLPKMYEEIGFIKYISQHQTYELHAVLRSVVRSELDQCSINITELYQRCAEWYEYNENCMKAFQCYMKIEDTEQCFRLIEKCHCSIIYGKVPSFLEAFFEHVTKEEKLNHPTAYLPFLHELITHDKVLEGKKLFEEAKEWYETQEQEDLLTDRNSILGELSIIEWDLAFNDLEEMTTCAKRAYELLDGKKSAIFYYDVVLTYGTPEIQVLYHSKSGELKKTVELEKQYTQYYMKLIGGYGGGWDSLFETEYCLAVGDYEKAETLIDFVCEKAEYRKQFCVILSGYFARLRIAVHKGDKEKFELYLQELKLKLKDEIRPILQLECDLVVSYMYGIIGKADKMNSWVKECNISACNRIMRSARVGYITYGLWLMKEQKWLRLEVLAEEMSVPYSTTKHVIVTIYSYIYYAIAQYHLKGLEKGKRFLLKGIEIAKMDNIKLPFVENIIEIEPMLKALEKEDSYIKELLSIGQEQKKGIELIAGETLSESSEVLTKRESELMDLVEKGYKNVEISDTLNIAQVTVEKTLTNIYRKLKVRNRTTALARLKEIRKHI